MNAPASLMKEALHPLSRVESFEALMALPYFEQMACLGVIPLHPGGLERTGDLLIAARLQPGARVLEVGSGTGASTVAMLRAGLDVTVVEPCRRMAEATAHNCVRYSGRAPEIIVSGIEQVHELPSNHFDAALCECVLGFFQDKAAGIAQLDRVLRRDVGTICINDFYYRSAPPDATRTQLQAVTGTLIETQTLDDVRTTFSGWRTEYWQTLDPPVIPATNAERVASTLRASGFIDAVPGTGDERFQKLADAWNHYNASFNMNKQYLTSYLAVWRRIGQTATQIRMPRIP